jgi:hypothetical protein
VCSEREQVCRKLCDLQNQPCDDQSLCLADGLVVRVSDGVQCQVAVSGAVVVSVGRLKLTIEFEPGALLIRAQPIKLSDDA